MQDNYVKQKKDDSNTPYSLNRAGNGLPDQLKLNHKFTRPSSKNFTMNLSNSPRHKIGHHVVSY